MRWTSFCTTATCLTQVQQKGQQTKNQAFKDFNYYFPVRMSEQSICKENTNCIQWGTVILFKSTSRVSMIEHQFNFGKYHNKKTKQPIQNSENAKDTDSPQFNCGANGCRSLTLATSFITIWLNKGNLSLSLLDFSKIFNAIIIHLGKNKRPKYTTLSKFSSYIFTTVHVSVGEGCSTARDSLLLILQEWHVPVGCRRAHGALNKDTLQSSFRKNSNTRNARTK